MTIPSTVQVNAVQKEAVRGKEPPKKKPPMIGRYKSLARYK